MVDLVEIRTWDSAARDAVERIRSASADADGQDPLDEAASMRLRDEGLETSRIWLAGDSGFAVLHDGGLDLAVAPTARRCGFGTALAAAAAAEASTAWSHGDHPAAARLAERHGFRRARELWVMRRPATVALDPASADPRIRTYRPEDDAELLRVNAAAFAAHPEQGAMDTANLAARMAEPWFDPAGLFVADGPEGLLGFHWTKVHPDGTGEVYVVGIDPAAQGQGLGKALTSAGLHHLAGRGVPEVILYVESDNAPAIAVYSGLGFGHAPADTHVQYRRPTDP
ncbi:mycothiol synthase [Nocardioides speluncae]|uniref:mycothiol synthase n=1 Tax=Nocardioides speluncae TaxID=2670337 RepID=UPI000D69A316|nr:mycothiol synthase [Nocardioides speluncae]